MQIRQKSANFTENLLKSQKSTRFASDCQKHTEIREYLYGPIGYIILESVEIRNQSTLTILSLTVHGDIDSFSFIAEELFNWISILNTIELNSIASVCHISHLLLSYFLSLLSVYMFITSQSHDSNLVPADHKLWFIYIAPVPSNLAPNWFAMKEPPGRDNNYCRFNMFTSGRLINSSLCGHFAPHQRPSC